jgi:hypothetical protein
MNDRKTAEEAESVLKEINYELKTQPLTPEQRSKLERHAAALAGYLLNPWLPRDMTRRLIMAAIVLLGLQQAWVGNYQVFFWWALLPFFSPRLMGNCAYGLGRITRFFKGN